jgi:phospholipid/cholesterol/gamma-HCH transport system substrate-binding protein
MKRPRMPSLRDSDPAVVAIVGTIVGALVVLLSVNLNRLPFLGSSTAYHAEFAAAGGLASGNQVRVAGMQVGSVSSVRVSGGHVDVRFTVRSGVQLGATSAASVEVATVLGEVFLQVDSAGPGVLRAGGTIPLARTTVPYTLLDAFGAVGQNVEQTNLPQLQQSLDQLAAALNGTSTADVGATLTGLTKFAQALGSRQDELSALLANAKTVTATLAGNGAALVQLLGNGDTFLKMLTARHDVINRILSDTAQLGVELSGLVQRDGAQLSGVLDNLQHITAVLAADRAQLENSIKTLGQFSVNFTNVTGSGPWVDLMLPAALEPDNVIVACGKAPKPGCGS